MFIFKNIDSTILDLTNDEKIYFSQLEEKCGIKFEINSPWFYFGALAMCYMGKAKVLFLMNKMAKEEKKLEEEKKKAEQEKEEEISEEAEVIDETEEEIIVRKNKNDKKHKPKRK